MTTERRRYIEGGLCLALFVLTIPLANWMVGNVGTICIPQGPCLVPVAPGLKAPSGVLMIGLALVLRDLVQRRLGAKAALGAIVAGTILSALVAPQAIVLASATAFLISELADFAIYTPLQKRDFVLAVAASSFIGLVLDSILFLWLAFGSLDFLAGQIVGKAWMVLLALPVARWLRTRDEKLGLQPA